MTKKQFDEIINRIFPIRNILVVSSDDPYGPFVIFDYPNYGGLPKRLSNTLSPEAVDAMQVILHTKYIRKRDFAKAYKDQLFYYGEPGNYLNGKSS